MAKEIAESRGSETLETLLKWVNRVVWPAAVLARMMLIAALFALLVSFICWYYFVISLDWVFWGWILSIIFVLVPALSAFFFWYAFSMVRDLPEVVREFKGQWEDQLPKYKNFITEGEERRGVFRKARFAMHLAIDVYKISDGVDGVVSGVSVLTFAASPPAWILALGTLIACIAGPMIVGLVVLIQLIFN